MGASVKSTISSAPGIGARHEGTAQSRAPYAVYRSRGGADAGRAHPARAGRALEAPALVRGEDRRRRASHRRARVRGAGPRAARRSAEAARGSSVSLRLGSRAVIMLLIAALVVAWLMFSYNRLVRLRNQVRT